MGDLITEYTELLQQQVKQQINLHQIKLANLKFQVSVCVQFDAKQMLEMNLFFRHKV